MIFVVIILLVIFHIFREAALSKQSAKIIDLINRKEHLEKEINRLNTSLRKDFQESLELATGDQLCQEMFKRRKVVIIYTNNSYPTQINSNIHGEEISQVLHHATNLTDRDI